ncbi:MAG: hypothetical protein ACLR56_12225 [Oscillospiraceae bacterium]
MKKASYTPAARFWQWDITIIPKDCGGVCANPLNTAYPETVYKTGDLVKLNENGELIYISRKDFQIKHMGYRIELGEIEAAAYATEGLSSAAVVYDKQEDKIILIYTGRQKDSAEIMNALKADCLIICCRKNNTH